MQKQAEPSHPRDWIEVDFIAGVIEDMIRPSYRYRHNRRAGQGSEVTTMFVYRPTLGSMSGL